MEFREQKAYDEYEAEEEQRRPPVSPFGVYFNSSSISLAILFILEIEEPIKIPLSQLVILLDDLLLRLHPRFSSIVVTGKDGEQRWKRVEINLKDHIKTPIFPEGKSPEFYDECFNNYLSKLSAEPLPENLPMWQIHLVKYRTTKAAGNVVFRLHHAIGDGYSLMAALLSCFKRSDDPSLPLTFPANQIRRSSVDGEGRSVVSRALSSALNTVSDLWMSFAKTKLVADDLSPVRSGEIGVGFRPISAATMTFSLDQIKQIKTQLGMTVNDVVTGTVFLGTRMYMQDTEPGSEDLETTSIVVLNTRMLRSYTSVHDMMNKETDSPWGNHFAFLHVALPKLMAAATGSKSKNNMINNGDLQSTMASRSLEFLKATQKLIRKKRSSLAVHINARLIELYRKLKGSEAASTYVYWAVKNTSMAITNMIGPTEKMTLADHHVKGMYFLIAGNPQNLTVTMVSYMGEMRVSIGTEKGFIDPDKLKSYIQRAFHLILNSTTQA